MAPAVEETYHDLLTPVKDPEKSFQVNIAALLLAYVKNFVDGKVPPNFNSAALLLQGSSSIYSKKVEYLHNLATQLYQNLSKQKKDDPNKKETNNNNNKVKDKHKENKFSDPFFSTEIKMGKNLSCLKKKNPTKNAASKKSQKKQAKKHTFVPVDLLPFEGEEKGDVFYDTRGDLIGNKGDYTLNKCRVTTSGWLTLPTVSPDQVPSKNSPPDYTFCMDEEEDDHCNSFDMPFAGDEGIDLESNAPSQATSKEQSSPVISLSQQTDEGLGSMFSTPSEAPSSQILNSQPTLSQPSEAMEGIECSAEPLTNGIGDIEPDVFVDVDPSKSLRRSMRQAQKAQQDEDEAGTSAAEKSANKEEEMPLIKKAIQKKNTCSLPARLRNSGFIDIDEIVSEFCARTYFSVDNKFFKTGVFPLETPAFRNNANFLKKLIDCYNKLKSASRKNKKIDDMEENEIVDVEALSENDPDDMMVHDPLEDEDIVINNDVNELPVPDSQPPLGELSQVDVPMPPVGEGPIPEPETADMDLDEIKTHTELEKNAEIAAKVKKWQDKIAPFLNELDRREAFDINLYGSRILNSFDQCTPQGKQRKQTKTFKDFCRGMKKWQIHRYFMALLPLANIGNVSLEAEVNEEGEEEIMITLISKKMHHLRLEEFGNEQD